MSVLLPNCTHWTPANWISRAFLSDSRAHLSEMPYLANDIRFCNEADVDTLDLRNANEDTLAELKSLVQRVLADAIAIKGSTFEQPEYFPVYLGRLKELDALVEKAIADLRRRKM